MDLSMISLVVTGLVTVVFLVAVALSYKTWRVYTIGLLLLNYMAALCFFFYGAGTLKTHQEWRVTAAKFAAGLAREEKNNHELIEGVVDEDRKQLITPGIKWNERWHHHLMLSRGRVWEGCQPGTADPATGRVQVNVPKGGNQIVVKPAANAQEQGEATIVYIFEEADVEQNGRYLGEFNVVKKEDTDSGTVVDLLPTRKVQGVELTRIADRTRVTAEKGWVMYAVMPRDNHRVFHRLSLVDGEAKFTTLDDQALRALAPKKAVGESDVDYEVFVKRWVAEYLHDMQELDEYLSDMKIAKPDDIPDARRWMRVRFKKLKKLKTIAPHSVLPLTKAGEVEFVPGEGDQALLDRATFQKLDKEGVVRQQGEEYVRELRDYGHLFRDYDRTRVKMVAKLIDLQRELHYFVGTATLVGAETRVLAREASRKKEFDLLAADEAGFKAEAAGVAAYATRLEQHKKDLFAEVRRLHYENQALAKELTELQLAAKRRLAGKTPAQSTSLPSKSGADL